MVPVSDSARIFSISMCAVAASFAFVLAAAGQTPNRASTEDPRYHLKPGWMDAGVALWNMKLTANQPRPSGFFLADDPGFSDLSNTDIAFEGSLAVVGNYSGFMVYDITHPTRPELRLSVFCPGGQGDVSIFRNLVFMSVEQVRGRLDCGPQGVDEAVSPDRFRGIRIFDISDLAAPVQVAAVQSCRGSHTHTLVTAPEDSDRVWVYISGTGVARTSAELPGCSGPESESTDSTSYSRIEVVEVPLDRPHDARIVSTPRIFANEATGELAGLWRGGDHGPGTQASRATTQCHDITVFPALGLGAGACSGNGLLLDIRNPANPVRLDAVVDPNFAAWHSATFSNDGRTVVFTDEWGGGSTPRCRPGDPMQWGANAIFNLSGQQLDLVGYYKLPAAQDSTENCVAHNGSLVPVPGRDIKVQAWYQGGISVFDFTDPERPFEIAYFDRGPMSDTGLIRAGHWSSYWYNGFIYGAEKARGLDVLELVASEHLSQNEIDAAKLVVMERFNAQSQPELSWPARPVVAYALLDQLARLEMPGEDRVEQVRQVLDRALALEGSERIAALQRLRDSLAQDQTGNPSRSLEDLIVTLEALVSVARESP